MPNIGEALEAKGVDWRAQLRAAEIDRRPPPSQLGRPDRGYVDQSPPPSPPRRTVIPLERLQDAQRISAEDQQPMTPAPPRRRVVELPESHRPPPPPADRETSSSPPRPVPPLAPSESSVAGALALLTASAEPAQNSNREEPPVAATRRRTRKAWDPALKERVIKRVLQAKEEEKGRDDVPLRSGTQKRIAIEENVPEQLVSNWIHAWRVANKGLRWPGDIPAKQRVSAPPAQSRTLMSRPSPDSLGGRSLDAIMAELKATQQRVQELKAELRDALSD